MDVSEYWKKRGLSYYSEFQTHSKYEKARYKDQEERLKKLIQDLNFKTILEIGCGFGRYTKILSNLFDVKKYLATDLSNEQLENAKKYVNNDKIEFRQARIQEIDLNDKFDLVFASEILMHINFNDIENVIQKLISFSKNKIISIDWFNENKFGLDSGGYCFMHNYETLFKKYVAKKVTVHKIPLLTSLKLKNAYIKLRGKQEIETQAIIEVDV